MLLLDYYSARTRASYHLLRDVKGLQTVEMQVSIFYSPIWVHSLRLRFFWSTTFQIFNRPHIILRSPLPTLHTYELLTGRGSPTDWVVLSLCEPVRRIPHKLTPLDPQNISEQSNDWTQLKTHAFENCHNWAFASTKTYAFKKCRLELLWRIPHELTP